MSPNKSQKHPDNAFFQQAFLKMKTISEEVQFGVAVLDGQLRFELVNDRLASFNSLSAEQHRGRTIGEINPLCGSILEPTFRHVLDEGKPLLNLEVEIPPAEAVDDVESCYLKFSCYPLLDENGIVQGVGLIGKDVSAQKLKEVAQADRLRFETLLAALSATFINIPVSEVANKIELSLKGVNDFLGFDRITVWQFSPDDGRLYHTHTYTHLSSLMKELQPPAHLDDAVPVWVEMARQGEIFFISDIEDLPDNQWREKKYCHDHGGIKSILFIPLSVAGNVLGVISFVSCKFERKWPDVFVQRLRLLGEIIANALERKRVDQKIQQLKSRLEAENLYLRDQIDIEHKHESIIGQSDNIKRTLKQAEQVATTDSTVLVLGETGTGKELMAHAIHNLSPRKDRAMIKLNCAALPATLIESELFGREKGAFTGAMTRQIGRFEAADGSTIFLDEIGELPLELQSKLLRVLQEGQFERLGSPVPVTVDVRVIAATNRDLRHEVKRGTFREDLFYRLNVFPILVPPLRERRDDIPLLVWEMVKEFGKNFGKAIERIPKKNMEALQSYAWPGNVRELRNVIERGMILAKGSTLLVDLPEISASLAASVPRQTLAEVERAYILSVMEKCHWRVRGKDAAAEILGLKPTTLEARMKKLEIAR
jgi:transcriptional regulator with GAF, ATPase, and Fis domain